MTDPNIIAMPCRDVGDKAFSVLLAFAYIKTSACERPLCVKREEKKSKSQISCNPSYLARCGKIRNEIFGSKICFPVAVMDRWPTISTRSSDGVSFCGAQSELHGSYSRNRRLERFRERWRGRG